jgi:hypothetical protein
MIKQNIIIFFFLITCSSLSFAQKGIKDFEISIPNEKVTGSIYNTLQVVDIRDDTTHFGIVQLGAFNKKAFVMANRSLAEQMQDVLEALNGADTKTGQLLMLIRKFSFAEVTGSFKEKGYCQFRAVLFVKKEAGFRQLDVIDTVIVVGSMDVTRAMFRKASGVIAHFIKTNITKSEGEGEMLSFAQILAIDHREKTGLAVYNTMTYKDGLYKTYKSFADLTPAAQDILVEFSIDNNIKTVKKVTGNGKPERIVSKDIYAVVYEGKPYIATSYGFYSLKKRRGDFYFTGKEKISSNTKEAIMTCIFFGISGILIASSPQHTFFDMKIDHISGGFIRLREVKE